jgi:hypothetical protein
MMGPFKTKRKQEKESNKGEPKEKYRVARQQREVGGYKQHFDTVTASDEG